jgi:hypothetical protein
MAAPFGRSRAPPREVCPPPPGVRGSFRMVAKGGEPARSRPLGCHGRSPGSLVGGGEGGARRRRRAARPAAASAPAEAARAAAAGGGRGAAGGRGRARAGAGGAGRHSSSRGEEASPPSPSSQVPAAGRTARREDRLRPHPASCPGTGASTAGATTRPASRSATAGARTRTPFPTRRRIGGVRAALTTAPCANSAAIVPRRFGSPARIRAGPDAGPPTGRPRA